MHPHLEANFPRLFPKTPTNNQLEIPRGACALQGEAGSVAEGDVVFCDGLYLNSLLNKLSNIAMKTEAWTWQCAPPTVPLYSKFDPLISLREALTELAVANEHIQRLQKYPILFGNARTKFRFFQDASAILKGITISVRFALLNRDLNDAIDRLFAIARGGDSFSPVFEDSKEQLIPPWLTWCEKTKDFHKTLEAQTFQTTTPGLELWRSTMLPIQGVLIAEHWRKRVDNMIQDIAQASQAPHPVLGLRPHGLYIARKAVVEARGPIVRLDIRQPVMMLGGPKPDKGRAYGEQPPFVMGRLSRKIARLLGDYTTVGVPWAVMDATFVKEREAGGMEKFKAHMKAWTIKAQKPTAESDQQILSVVRPPS